MIIQISFYKPFGLSFFFLKATMHKAYKTIENPLETLVNESGKNVADILCPKEDCKCIILRKNTATLVERDGAKVFILTRLV